MKKEKRYTSYCLLYFFGQILIFCAFLFGICSYNGRELSVFSFLNEILEIFKMKGGLWFYYVFACTIGILYLVTLIKNVQILITFLGKFTYDNTESRLVWFRQGFSDSLKSILIFYMCSAFLGGVTLNELGESMIFIGVIVYLLGHFLIMRTKRTNITLLYAIVHTFYRGLQIFVVILLAPYLSECLAPTIIDGIVISAQTVDFSEGVSAVYSLFKVLVEPIFMAVILGLYLKEACAALDLEIGEWRSVLVALAIMVGIHFGLYVYLVGGSEDIMGTLQAFIEMVKFDSLQLLILSTAGWLISFFPMPRSKKIKKQADVDGRSIYDLDESLNENFDEGVSC